MQLQLQDLLERMTDGMVALDGAWHYTYVNQKAAALLSRTPASLVGKHIWTEFPEGVGRPFYLACHRAVAENTDVALEGYYPSYDKWFETRLYPLAGGLAVFFSDVTDRKKEQDALRQLNASLAAREEAERQLSYMVHQLESYRQALDVSALISMTDARGNIVHVNDQFCRVARYAPHELLGQNHRIVKSGHHPPAFFQDLWRTILAGRVWRGEILNRASDGSLYWVDTMINPIRNPQGEIINYLSIRYEITARKQAEADQTRLIEELSAKNRDLEQFTFITSHNLRAPVANLLGLVSIYNPADPTDPVNADVIDSIGRAAAALDGIITDLTGLLSIRGQLRQPPETVSFAKVFARVRRQLQWKHTGAVITTRFGVESVPSVPGYVQNILFNLLSNALKFRDPGRRPEITVSTRREEGYVVLTVTDNGLGIDLDRHHGKVFGLYQRFHLHPEGKGLGLHLVKTQAEALGGKVTVESKAGAGSTFRVYFRE